MFGSSSKLARKRSRYRPRLEQLEERTLLNIAPIAHAGGPYFVPEGGSVVLSSLGSFDPDGTIVSYEWDLNYNGSTFDVDSTDPSPIFSAALLDGPTTRIVALRVQDDNGAYGFATAVVRVLNVPPTLSNVTITPALDDPRTVTLSGIISDPGVFDSFTLRVDWGDGQTGTFIYGPGTVSFNETHVYPNQSTMYTVSLTLTDDDHVEGTLYGSINTTAGSGPGSLGDQYLVTLDLETGEATIIGILPGGGVGVGDIDYDTFTHRAWLQFGGNVFEGFEFDIHTAAGIGSAIPNFPEARLYNAMEFVGSTLYVSGIASSGSNNPSDFRILNPMTGVATFIGNTGLTGPIAGLAYDARTGIMYGLRGGQITTNNFVRIDMESGQATIIGSTGFRGGSLKFGPDGQLYGSSNDSHLYRIDPNTGNATLVGFSGIQGAMGGLTIDGLPAIDTRTLQVTITVDNSSPIPDAGGPYSVAEGESLTLDASASFDPDGDPLSFTWDINGDGVFGDATGVNPTLTWAQLVALGINDGPATFQARVRANDGHGNIETSAPVTLTVVNTPPTLSNVTLSTSITVGQQATLSGLLSDPGPLDHFRLVVDWGDGSPEETFHYAAGTPSFSETHIYDQPGTFMVTLILLDKDDGETSTTQTIQVNSESVNHVHLFAVGADAGSSPRVQVYNADGSLRFDFLAFHPSFTGGVRVAVGDVNGDNVDDIIVGAGAGGGPHVKVFSGVDLTVLANFFAFSPSFTGGVFVAAGNLNGDNSMEVIVGAGAGGGPHVRSFQIAGGVATVLPGPLGNFFAYASSFRGGVHVTAGNFDGIGNDEIITGAGAGGGPHVKVFRADGFVLASFFAYAPSFTGGVWVAAGDVNNDGLAEIITGAGAGGGPHVKVFNGGDAAGLHSFFAYSPAFMGGVRVGTVTRGSGQVLLGPGPGGAAHIRILDGVTLSALDNFFAFDPLFRGGVFVGGK
ncbi:MAG: PKD domain-containing protein [Gemmataceae bacterium]